MAFFGLTTLGPSNPMHEGTKQSQSYVFHQIPEEAYLDLFNANVLGDSNVALALDVNGTEHILRAKLGDMLKQLLGRQPRKFELEAWFTHCDFDRSALMGIGEYMQCVQKLIAFSSGSDKPAQYTSYDIQRSEWLRNVRVGYEPQGTYKAPLTTSHDIGWHSMKPSPASCLERKTLASTDVTIKEGRNAASYYGYFVCQ